MKALLVAGLFLCYTASSLCSQLKYYPAIKPLSDDMINFINKLNTTWKVCIYIKFGFQ